METRANSIRDALEQEIISGLRIPGERLDEPQLTRQFNVSRTPVREALVELATSGLVEMRPHRSAVVAEIGAGQVIQMYEVLAELEGLSARLAVRRMSEDERATIAAFHARIGRLIEKCDRDNFPALNKNFHDMIHAGAHNEILRAEIDGLNERIYDTLNNGVYKAGFAPTQKAYEEALIPLFATLDWLDERLSTRRYLTGPARP